MALRNSLDNLLSKSLILQLSLGEETEENLKLLFPDLYESSLPKSRRHAYVQTTPQVDLSQVEWVLELEGKVDKLCVKLSNIYNSVCHNKRVGQKAEVGGYELRFKTQFSSSKYPAHVTSNGQFESTSIEDSLKEILNLASEIKSTIPVLYYNTQLKNPIPEAKPAMRSLIPERAKPVNSRINDLLKKCKPRRSNSVPDFFEAMPFLTKPQKMAKRHGLVEETSKVPSASAARGFKNEQNVSSNNRACAHSGHSRNGRQENIPSSSKGTLASERASRTGAIPKKQTVVPTRARKASQTAKIKRAQPNTPRWKL